jgi:hypothetical protein
MATPIHTIRRQIRSILLENYALVTPGSPLVSPQGTPGAVAYSYAISSVNATGESKASAAKATATGAATLNSTNFNQITWTLDPAATSYNIYRTASAGTPSTTGLIGTATAATFDDTGLAGDGSTAPTENTSGIESPFWADDDLTEIIIKGCKDLWKGIVDLSSHHFTTDDITNMSIAANATSVTGVPSDCFRILSIEPRDMTPTSSFRWINFVPKPFHGPDFRSVRSLSPVDINHYYPVLYDLLNPGSPVSAPTIRVAPAVTTAIPLRVVYVHTLSSSLSESSDNPIPGESDNALVAWGVAYARALEREDRMPDPGWLSVYVKERQELLIVLSPRQEQEPQMTEAMFEDYW